MARPWIGIRRLNGEKLRYFGPFDDYDEADKWIRSESNGPVGDDEVIAEVSIHVIEDYDELTGWDWKDGMP